MELLVHHVAEQAAAGSNPGVGVLPSESMSHNKSEPDSASKRNLRVAFLPKTGWPAIDGEATSDCSRRALRGGWGWRMPTDQSRNLGGPRRWARWNNHGDRASGGVDGHRTNRRGEYISRALAVVGVGWTHSSEEAGQFPWSEGVLLDVRNHKMEGGPLG
jgi:hypothetical protein